jgi:hypothetical protein
VAESRRAEERWRHSAKEMRGGGDGNNSHGEGE